MLSEGKKVRRLERNGNGYGTVSFLSQLPTLSPSHLLNFVSARRIGGRGWTALN
jgi:hypothetical protein